MKYKNAKLLLLAILMFGVGVVITSQAPISTYAQKKQEVEYSCPMHPEVKSKKAGSCPKCGMTLKKKSTEPERESASTSSDDVNTGTNRFPNVELTTQDGKKVRFYDDLIKGKVVALELMYTTCKYNCPLETARLVQVQKLLGDRMGKDVFFYSLTIEPEVDTPKVLKAYAEKYHIGPGWTFLTGKEADIKLISRKLGLDFLPNPNDPDGHTPSLLIGNEKTGIWMRNSALDNTKFLALKIEQLTGYGPRPLDAATAANGNSALKLNIDKGQYLFATRCAACHTIGNGDKIGPDLLGVTNVRDHAWLTRMISDPDKLLQENDPIAVALFTKYKELRMPKMGLADEDVKILIEFMKNQTASGGNTEKPGTQN